MSKTEPVDNQGAHGAIYTGGISMSDSKHSVIAEVAGKVALVTGAASGIGKAIALLLHERGAKVIAEDIDPAVEELARPGLVPLQADITEDGAAELAVGLAVERFGRLDILVNNAGIIINKLVVDMTREDWERIQAVNATAAFLHCREAVKAMMPNRSGRSSISPPMRRTSPFRPSPPIRLRRVRWRS